MDANGDVDTVGAVNTGGNVAVTGSVQTTGDVQVAGEFTYSATRTFYLSMPFSAFQDDQPGLNTRWYLMDDCAYPNAGPVPHIVDLYAPVILPESATVTEVRVYYFDVQDPENLTISLELYRIPFALGNADTMASATTTTSGIVGKTDLTQTSVNNAVIDNQNYMYQLKVEFNSGDYANLNMGLFGARIAYTLNALKP